MSLYLVSEFDLKLRTKSEGEVVSKMMPAGLLRLIGVETRPMNWRFSLKIWKGKKSGDNSGVRTVQSGNAVSIRFGSNQQKQNFTSKTLFQWSWRTSCEECFSKFNMQANCFFQVCWNLMLLKSNYFLLVNNVSKRQCDQIGRFFALWATFQSLWQQLFCPNLPNS